MSAPALQQRKQFKPWAYQRYCIMRAVSDDKLGLLLDMGLGKTVITLTAINDLKYNRFEVRRVLIVAPKKVAEATWTNEVNKWDHLRMLRVVPVIGNMKKRIKALNTPGDVWVISRDSLAWLVEHYRNAWPFDMVVLDELSSFKGYDSQRFKVLTWVRPHIKRLIGLTGTPAPNGLQDLWAQIYLLDQGERLERNITAYRTKYFDRNYHGFGYMPKPGADEVIHRKISDICISMKAEDYLELPECVPNVIPVVLDDKAMSAYKKLEMEAVLALEDTEITALSAAALSGKLLQLCNGAIYATDIVMGSDGRPQIDDKGNVVTTRRTMDVHDCKIEAFMELIEQLSGKPALVFYNFQHDLERIKKALAKSGLRVRELKTKQDQDDWNAQQIDVLLAHPASAGHGLNLQDGGNHVVWFGLNWSLELYQQANKRLHRQGQQQVVILHHLVVQGGVDEDVMAALESKATTQDKLLAALKARVDGIKEAS
ncbi:DEAD/DEAH box helicase [Cohnella cholangitidis]|uniref:DEAD/DEAH box helicase n=1 Tax=Cohnella cholangitidis TaxID=2598458 RepID=A0A7G5C5H1_9BACL|nr:DEAD/DEAH box helicase [Cohnella cholangitidis]QMV44455.1 DEAD/DEAH box helicase [Cohnella cholangitidis]